MELFDEEVLFALGNAVGKVINVDDTTPSASRRKYARACVEIDLGAPLILSIMVLGCKQKVEYEGLFLIFFDCGKYSHRQDVCPVGKTHAPSMPEQRDAEDAREEHPFGPWMLPKSKYRQQQKLVPDQREAAAISPPTRVMDSGLGLQKEMGHDDMGRVGRRPTQPDVARSQNGTVKRAVRPHRSRFAVLEDLELEEDWASQVVAFIEKIQNTLGPGRAGPINSPSWTTQNK